MNTLSKTFNRLLSQGVCKELTKEQNQDIRFINAEALIVFFLCFPAVPFCYFVFPDKNYYIVLFFLFLLYFSTLLLNRFRLYQYAKASILLVAEISLFWASSTFGKESNLHYIFIILAFASVITFQKNGKKTLFFTLAFCVLLLIGLYVTDFSLFDAEELSPFQIETVRLIGFSLCFLGSVVIAFFYINKFNEQRQIIEKYNKELESKQKEIEQQNIELNQKSVALEKLNTTKDKLFGIIGHDLRSPINSLKGIMDLLSDEIISPEEFVTLSGKLKNNVERIQFTLNNLLEWANTQLKGLITKPITTNLFQLVEENFNFLEQLASSKEISLCNQVDAHLEAYIDPDQINLVFRNLINNAIKFTPKKGTITLKSTTHADFCTISVIDTGVGIDAESVAKLFNQTSHLTTYGTDGEKGTGLGLLLCQEMVEKNNGTIWAESQVGKGTTFSFTLPLGK